MGLFIIPFLAKAKTKQSEDVVTSGYIQTVGHTNVDYTITMSNNDGGYCIPQHVANKLIEDARRGNSFYSELTP